MRGHVYAYMCLFESVYIFFVRFECVHFKALSRICLVSPEGYEFAFVKLRAALEGE